MKTIDLNCDMGELPKMIVDGSQAALMTHITSANVACGAHAGNAEMMRATIEQAIAAGVGVGAHPGYEDIQNFGRVELQLSVDEIEDSVYRQVVTLDKIAAKCGAQIMHVKPHGALYNQAVSEAAIARAIADGVRRWKSGVVMVGLASSVMLTEFRASGFQVAAEAFADRRYENDGSLRSRKYENALLREPEEAAAQALRIAAEGSAVSLTGQIVPIEAQTICVHGDSQKALEIARAIQKTLERAGITPQALRLA